MTKKKRDASKEQWWRKIVRRFARSGLSVRAFCQREKLAESAFYFWRRELARRDEEAHADRQASIPASATNFVPVRVSNVPSPPASLALELTGGRVLRLPQSMPIERIAELILALEMTSLVAERAR